MAPNNGNSPKSRAAASGGGKKPSVPERAASFHGRLPAAEPNRLMRRPKTQPDLLSGRRAVAGAAEGGGLSSGPSAAAATPIRVPAKVLVNVTVQRSLGAVQVMASTDWTVGQLAAAALRQYIKEGRRPLLPSKADAAAYGLHYSQFSLDCLDPEEKLIGLGSRNFFLCPKTQNQANEPPAVSPPSSCSNEAEKATPRSSFILPWIRFMDFLL